VSFYPVVTGSPTKNVIAGPPQRLRQSHRQWCTSLRLLRRLRAPRKDRLRGAPRKDRLKGAPRKDRLKGAPRKGRLKGAPRKGRLKATARHVAVVAIKEALSEYAFDRCILFGILCAKRRCIMRSTIDINDELLEEAKALTGAKTKKELIDLSLRELIRRRRREHLASLFGSGVLAISADEIEKMREDDL